MADFAPIHPGEILRTDYMESLGLTASQLAQATHVSQTRIGGILKGTLSITAETGLLLSQALGTSETFWTNLQTRYDMEAVKDAKLP